MSEAPVPNNFIDLVPAILFGIFAFAFGFEAVVAINVGQLLLCLGDIAACLVLAAAAVVWLKHKEWLPQKLVSTTISFVTDWRWLFAAFVVLLMASAISPYVEQQRWPFAPQFASLLGPTADEVAEAVVHKLPKPLADAQTQKRSEQDQRSLTDQQKRKLTTEFAKLRTLTSHLVLSLTNGDPESDNYTHNFADAVRRAGMEPLWGFALPDNPDQIGVIIALKDPHSPPPETEPLRAALQSIGLEPKILGFPSSGFSVSGVDFTTFHPNIVLWIAPRPL